MWGADSNPWLATLECTKWIFEYDSRDIAFTFTLGFDAILASWALLAAFDPSFTACCPYSVIGKVKWSVLDSLLRHPVFVRFRAFIKAAARAVSAATALASAPETSVFSSSSTVSLGSCLICAGALGSGIFYTIQFLFFGRVYAILDH